MTKTYLCLAFSLITNTCINKIPFVFYNNITNQVEQLTMNLKIACHSCLPCLVSGHTFIVASVFRESLDDAQTVYTVGARLHTEVLGRLHNLVVPVPGYHRGWTKSRTKLKQLLSTNYFFSSYRLKRICLFCNHQHFHIILVQLYPSRV